MAVTTSGFYYTIVAKRIQDSDIITISIKIQLSLLCVLSLFELHSKYKCRVVERESVTITVQKDNYTS